MVKSKVLLCITYDKKNKQKKNKQTLMHIGKESQVSE